MFYSNKVELKFQASAHLKNYNLITSVFSFVLLSTCESLGKQ